MLDGKKILVIDDNKTDVAIIKLLLSDFNVISNDIHSNIVKYIIRERPDCILLGCSLRESEGFNLLNSLKDDDFGRKIPIIILTEYDSSDFALEITKNGACDYLIKGYFSKNNLIKSIFLGIERQKLVNTVYEQQKELKKLAILDELTGINNRRSLIDNIEKHIDLSKRYKFSLSLAICDIDDFKSINDNYGHVVGDSVLKEVACIISSRIRKVDIAGRHGGDEFIVVFPNTSIHNATKTTDLMRQKILSTCENSHKLNSIKRMNIDNNTDIISPLKVSLSFGIAEFTPDINIADELIAKADEALYFSKQNGKNAVAYKVANDKPCIFQD
jgi:two-component system, cell cycle response regulator